MSREQTHRIRYLRPQVDERNRRRLKKDLGMNDEAVEVIMNLRSQVIALQRQIHELETLVETYQSESGSRLTRYRQVYLEAVWDDVIEKNRKGERGY